MERKIIITADGSPTIFVPQLNEHYHSVFGAVQESQHVFIKSGLKKVSQSSLSILEVGFGTGLNAYLTFESVWRNKQQLYYESWERYPLTDEEINCLTYPDQTGLNPDLFQRLHQAPWNTEAEIGPNLMIRKVAGDIRLFESNRWFDLVYFDAFGPEVQPDLWSEEVFRRIAARQPVGSLLVTYSVKGLVKRNLAAAGYQVTKVPGPPGKREISLARRIV